MAAVCGFLDSALWDFTGSQGILRKESGEKKKINQLFQLMCPDLKGKKENQDWFSSLKHLLFP